MKNTTQVLKVLQAFSIQKGVVEARMRTEEEFGYLALNFEAYSFDVLPSDVYTCSLTKRNFCTGSNSLTLS